MPTSLGRYEICGKLAEGGMAAIYVGRLRGAKGFTRTVAIKMMRPDCTRDPNHVAMFIDEANLVAKLAHPNVVQIYELGEEDGQLFIVMEMLHGRTLAEIWEACQARNLRLRGDLVAWIGARVAEGLHHAHGLCDADGTPQNLVHRDVNPANVFVTYDGHVKLLDFGLVKAKRKKSQTEIGVVKGKLAYLSPEQITGGIIDRRTDVFSLAATLYELSTDRRLFKRDTDEETIHAVREALVPDPTASVPDYSSLLWLVLRRALAREPGERYATAQELARDLDGVARAQGSIIQTATLAEVMGELFGSDRAREISLLRAGSPDAVLAQADGPAPSPSRRIRSPHLVPTKIEPSIVAPIPKLPEPPAKSRLVGWLAAAVVALALITVIAAGAWRSHLFIGNESLVPQVGAHGH